MFVPDAASRCATWWASFEVQPRPPCLLFLDGGLGDSTRQGSNFASMKLAGDLELVRYCDRLVLVGRGPRSFAASQNQLYTHTPSS
eukprot:2723519-Amphidinium_carterae.1